MDKKTELSRLKVDRAALEAWYDPDDDPPVTVADVLEISQKRIEELETAILAESKDPHHVAKDLLGQILGGKVVPWEASMLAGYCEYLSQANTSLRNENTEIRTHYDELRRVINCALQRAHDVPESTERAN
jgi:hypothetical protein